MNDVVDTRLPGADGCYVSRRCGKGGPLWTWDTWERFDKGMVLNWAVGYIYGDYPKSRIPNRPSIAIQHERVIGACSRSRAHPARDAAHQLAPTTGCQASFGRDTAP